MRDETDLSRKRFHIGLAVCYGLHLIIISLYLFDVIPQKYHHPERIFQVHQGGDQIRYFELAKGVWTGDLEASALPLGFPLLLVPFVAAFRPETSHDLIGVVSAFWGLGMFGGGQIVLARIGERVLLNRAASLLAVFLWTLLPLLVYGASRMVGSAVFAEVNSVHLTWMHMLSDGPATLVTLLTVLSFFWAMDRPERGTRWLAVGLLAGLGVLIRTPGVLTAGALAVVLIIERRFRALVVLTASAILAYTPQLLYNARVFGNPFSIGYREFHSPPEEGFFSASHLWAGLGELWERAGVTVPLVLLSLVGVTLVGLALIWKRNRRGAVVVGLWLSSYVAFFSALVYSWDGSLPRYLMPAYPAAALAAAGLAISLNRLSEIGSRANRPGS